MAHTDGVVNDGQSILRTFLIADIRGYTRYTEEFGDEAAASLAAEFAELVTDEVEAHGGRLVELRGDEALAVFTSARQAIRAAVDLQAKFGDETGASSDIPLKVGMGIDSGEAVELEDGSFRGASLNVAARLCGRAHGGDVLVSEPTVRLAGRLGGLQYSDRGRVRLKGIPDAIHIYQVYSELDARPTNRWTLMIFGKPARTLGWKLGLARSGTRGYHRGECRLPHRGRQHRARLRLAAAERARGADGAGGARRRRWAGRDHPGSDLEGLQPADGAGANSPPNGRLPPRETGSRTGGRSRRIPTAQR